MKRYIAALTQDEPIECPDALIYLAHRRFETPFTECAEMLGLPITPQTYPRMCQYQALTEIHFAYESGKVEEKDKVFQDFPEMSDFYRLTLMGET